MVLSSQQAKKNRRIGAKFAHKVRSDFEELGWTVSKWQNNVDLEKSEICPAKGNRFMMRTLGFPDFVMFKRKEQDYELMLVECKFAGKLSKDEREKIAVLKGRGFKCFLAYNDDGETAYTVLYRRL